MTPAFRLYVLPHILPPKLPTTPPPPPLPPGFPCLNMYWIVNGYADLSMEGDILCTLGPGDFFNEPALLPVPDQVRYYQYLSCAPWDQGTSPTSPRYCRYLTRCATAGPWNLSPEPADLAPEPSTLEPQPWDLVHACLGL